MKIFLTISFALMGVVNVFAQTDSLELSHEDERIEIRSAFDGNTVINSQSTNVSDQGQLAVVIGHRFGTVQEGLYNFYGLDEAVMRMGFEYGLYDKITVGIGRSTAGKNYDGYLKYRLLTQTKGAQSGNVPVTVTFFASSAFSSQRLRILNESDDKNYFFENLVYTYQTIISRKFSQTISFQLSPTLIHRNLTEVSDQLHSIYALGSAVRVKLKGKLSLNLDYSYVWNKEKIALTKLYDPIGVGLEVVTGGHVFKLHFTNSVGIIEKEYLTNTTNDFFKGEMRFGFTLLRSFMVKPKVKGGSIY